MNPESGTETILTGPYWCEGRIRPGKFLVRGGTLNPFEPGIEMEGLARVERVACEGWILLPGLVDAHVHLHSEQDVEEARGVGVYGLRDAGSASGDGFRFRNGIRIATAGRALVPASGYGRFLGERVSDADEVEPAIDRLKTDGADFVKAIGSGLVDFMKAGQVGAGGFRPEDLRHLIRVAHVRGLKVSVHANGDEAVRAAVEAGAYSVEHGYFMSRETLRLMADRGVYWVPTVYAVAWRLGDVEGMSESGFSMEAVREAVDTQMENLALASSYDVRLALGTDAGSPGVRFALAVIEEMSLWLKAGIPLEVVLQAATDSARALSGLPAPAFREGQPHDLAAIRVEGCRIESIPLFDNGRIADASDFDRIFLPSALSKAGRITP